MPKSSFRPVLSLVSGSLVVLLSSCGGGETDTLSGRKVGPGGVAGEGGSGGGDALDASYDALEASEVDGEAGGSSGGGVDEGGLGGAGNTGTPEASVPHDADFSYDAPLCTVTTGCDGGVCVNGACCAVDKACGSACCDSGHVCSFQKCEVPGDVCIDSTDCGESHYCDYSLGEPAHVADGGTCVGGKLPATGRCLPRPPSCEPGVEVGPGDVITCLPVCEHRPEHGSFTPVLTAHWNKGDIMMAPIVIQLDDDNCDGVVDERDIPEIVFSTFDNGAYTSNGTLWAISIVDGVFVDKWSVKPTVDPIHPGVSLAGGNIDGEPGNEIVACTMTGKVRAFRADGTELWISDVGGCSMPSIGDVDGDGFPEVLVEGRILNGVDGTVKAVLDGGNTGNVVFSDMDGDGFLDVVSPAGIWHGDGTRIATVSIPGSYVAIGDFDGDGIPEVASINNPNHTLSVWQYDASDPNGVKVLRTGIDINGTFPMTCGSGSSGYTRGGGPPTIADFNGDGVPDVAVAGGIGYAVIDGTKILDASIPPNATNLWLQKTQDCSSASTGSSVFDFEGDGKAEVLYSDEVYLRVYDGTNGNVLFQTCNTTGTLQEYPLIADVDNDGHADLIVVSNSYSGIVCEGTKQRGVRVFGNNKGNWVRTRRIWNQHAYHVTNVNEDGSIPTKELPNWTQPRLNNFRQNVQPLGEFSAPDLVVEMLPPPCNTEYALYARVTNIGQASVPAGVYVGFYEENPAAGGVLIGTVLTSHPLYPAESEIVTLPQPYPPAGYDDGSVSLYVVVDDGSPPHAWTECRTDNNVGGPASGKCMGGSY